ncbi:T9SS type A sorting domain-containing protein [Flavicella sediminum]|uniref:T9SS type A sorting domain-containing protein n=1 Tax=Flavicella sediminum TaxID=2585141 RepID=UPI0011229594|nr:T9SS type A sorting domain-containing protein [Flavicella sediminum]
MKNNYILIFALICAFSSSQNASAGHSQQCFDTRTSAKINQRFSRTFGACRSKKSDSNKNSSALARKNFKNRNRALKRQNTIEITYNDFLDHLSLAKTRNALVYDNSFTMDIGYIDSGENEIWELPNLTNLNAVSINFNHVAPEESGVLEDFPDDATHAVYSESEDLYEIYSLNEFDLFLYGYGEIDEEDYDDDGDTTERISVDYYGTKSPVPLKLGEGYEGIVTFINEEPEGEELDSIQYRDIYYVVGQGTLKTFDDGDAEAIKLIYTEETREYKDGEVVLFETRDEIIIYSKEGHYVRAGINNPWNSEGLVTLNDINYQKVQGKTASIGTVDLNEVKIFPNPIVSGEILTIQSNIALSSYVVELYTIQGQKIQTFSLLDGNSSQQYKIKVPETLAGGIYFYQVHNEKGSRVKTGKIQVL